MRLRNLVPRLAGLLLVAAHALATPILVAIPGIVSTGAGLSQGAIDVNYLLISAPAGVPTSILHPVVVCSVVGCDGGTIAAFPFANSPIVWAANGVNSQWVGVNAVQYGDSSGNPGPADPSGLYTFQVSFFLPDSLAVSTAHISGYFWADNQVEIWLNTSDITGCQSTQPPYCFQEVHSLDITSGFVVGVNTLQFVVYNAPQDSGNPVGLRVGFTEADYMSDVPEPGTAALWVAGLAALAVLRRRKAS